MTRLDPASQLEEEVPALAEQLVVEWAVPVLPSLAWLVLPAVWEPPGLA